MKVTSYFLWLGVLLTSLSTNAGAYLHPKIGVTTTGGDVNRLYAHEAWLGRPMDVVNDFIPSTDWSGWTNPKWILNAYKTERDRIILSVPMLPGSMCGFF